MSKINLGNGYTGEVAMAGQMVKFVNGIADVTDPDVLTQAQAAKLLIVDDTAKEALIARAKELGISAKSNWGEDTIRAKIAEAEAALQNKNSNENNQGTGSNL